MLYKIKKAFTIPTDIGDNYDIQIRNLFFKYIGFFGILVFALWTIINIHRGLWNLALIDAIFIILLLFTFLALKTLKNPLVVYRFSVLALLAEFLHMFYTGGNDGERILWFFVFPPIAFFLLGLVEGTTLSIIGAILAFLLIDPIGIHDIGTYQYSNTFLARFFVIYPVLIIAGFIYEALRKSSYNMLRESKKKLEIEHEKQIQLNKELSRAIEQVKTLSGFIPICSSCKKIRDDQGFWDSVERYISEHSQARFTHSLCPDCAEKLYPGLSETEKS